MKTGGRIPPYILILALGFSLAGYVYYAYVFSPMAREAREISQHLEIVARRIGSVAEKGETLAGLRAQYEQALKALQAVDSTVTQERAVPYFLRDLERASSASGAGLESLSMGSLSPSGPYAEVPVTIEVKGSYQQIGTFVKEILSHGRALSVVGVRLAAPGGAGDVDAKTAETVDATFSLLLYVVPKGGSD